MYNVYPKQFNNYIFKQMMQTYYILHYDIFSDNFVICLTYSSRLLENKVFENFKFYKKKKIMVQIILFYPYVVYPPINKDKVKFIMYFDL